MIGQGATNLRDLETEHIHLLNGAGEWEDAWENAAVLMLSSEDDPGMQKKELPHQIPCLNKPTKVC